jgi:hypothetical protein
MRGAKSREFAVSVERTKRWRRSGIYNRPVIHLGRKVRAPYFINIGPSGKRISHAALVRTATDLRTILPFLREGFDLATSEEP